MNGMILKILSCPPYRWYSCPPYLRYFGRRVGRRAFLCALCVLGGESLSRLRRYLRT
jgi:hypothetical protein